MNKHRLFVAAVMFGLTCAGITRAEESIGRVMTAFKEDATLVDCY